VWSPGRDGKTAAGTLRRGKSTVLQTKNYRLTAAGGSCHGCIWCGSREFPGV